MASWSILELDSELLGFEARMELLPEAKIRDGSGGGDDGGEEEGFCKSGLECIVR